LSFLAAIEEYQAEIGAKYKVPNAEELVGMPSGEVEKWLEVGVEVGKAGEALGDVAGGMFVSLVLLLLY
jgi:nucleoporin NDC1